MKKEKKSLDCSKSSSEDEIPINNSIADYEDLKKRLIEENNFITMLVDTIPAKMYFDQDIQKKLTEKKHLAMNKTAKEIKRKSTSSQELSSKNKHKRARLDPLFHRSVSEIHQELNKHKPKKETKSMLNQSASVERAANIEELQKKLRDRINQLQAKRKSCTEADVLEKKRLKRKMKKINLKKKGNKMKPNVIDNQNNKTVTKKVVKKIVPSTVYNKEGKIIYSKFDFSDTGNEEEKKSEYSGKKSKTLLRKAEKEKEKIEDLKKVDAEKAETLIQKAAWKRAIQKSEGIKVKDDPELLKKSIKKEEKKKNKSTKLWKERKEQVENRVKARQEKRSKNIKARKKNKLDHKIKQAKKKGRVIPGF